MKRICLAGALLLGASASAQTLIPGMKKDVVTPHSASATPMGFMALVQLLLALAVVFVLVKYLLPKVVAKAGKRLTTKVGSGIKVEESASFGGGMLYVVEARGKSLLLSVGTQGVSCLADLTQTGPAQDPTATFREMLEEQPENPIAPFQAAVSVPEEPETRTANMSEDEVREALARLRKIVD